VGRGASWLLGGMDAPGCVPVLLTTREAAWYWYRILRASLSACLSDDSLSKVLTCVHFSSSGTFSGNTS